MSAVACERCKKLGGRAIGKVSPEGWFFGSFTFADNGNHDPGDCLIVHACSTECRDALWTQQAGHTWAEIERRVDVKGELLRAARLHGDRLRAEAAKIRESTFPTGEQANEAASLIFASMLDDAAGALLERAEQEVDWINEKAGNAGAGRMTRSHRETSPKQLTIVAHSGDWFSVEYDNYDRLQWASIEGDREQMLGVATAIEQRTSVRFKRISATRVQVVGSDGFYLLSSPRNSIDDTKVTLAEADVLADAIRRVVAETPTADTEDVPL